MVTPKALLTINLYQVAFWAMIWITLWGIVRLFKNAGNKSEINDDPQWHENDVDYYDAPNEEDYGYEEEEW